jgi:hypothetical protein
MSKQLQNAIRDILDVRLYESEKPISLNVNDVVDKLAPVTDIKHPSDPQDEVEFVVAIKDLLASNPNADLSDIYRSVEKEINDDKNKQGEDMKQVTSETVLREQIRSILNEAIPEPAGKKPNLWNSMVQGGNYSNKPPTPEELEDLRAMLAKVPSDKEDVEDDKPHRIRGKGDEQAGEIVQALKDTFGIDMSSSQFSNFDRSVKMRYFVTAVLANEEPNMLERLAQEYVSDLEDNAKETGVLDKELETELLELEDLLVQDPSASEAFSEYIQAYVTDAVNSMSEAQWKDIVDRANSFFGDIPGGIMKYNREGTPDYEYLRVMLNRRQTSKDFAGSGGTGGAGNALDRFTAGVSHPKFPPEE